MHVQQEVLDILGEVLNLEGQVATLVRDSPLFGALPELDSMSVMALVTTLEERFGFTLEVEELDSSSFATLGTLIDFVETKLNESRSGDTRVNRLATGFAFTEGPLWHPDGFYYFVDLSANKLYRITPGHAPEIVRETEEGNGTTFDLQGRLIHCEGGGRKVTRLHSNGKVEVLADRFMGGRFNRPNDVVCRSDGSIFFTDPDKRVPYVKREIPDAAGFSSHWDGAAVYRVATDGAVSLVANCEYPNGLAFSPDERTLYVANTRSSKYIHALEIDAAGKLLRRSIFADMNAGHLPGIPDGLKVDSLGRVYCTGPGGIWVFTPDGRHVETIEFPEQSVNFAFGGADLRTLFCCAHTSVYTLQMKVPGQPHPWYRVRGG